MAVLGRNLADRFGLEGTSWERWIHRYLGGTATLTPEKADQLTTYLGLMGLVDPETMTKEVVNR